MFAVGLTEMMLAFLIAAIPSVIIYFDSKKKKRNTVFWVTSVFFGFLFGVIPGILLIIVYVLYYNNSSDKLDKKTNKNKTYEILKFFNKNERKVLELLLDKKTVSQSEIAEKTGLSPATVSRIINKFENKGIVVRYRNGMSKKVELSEDFYRN